MISVFGTEPYATPIMLRQLAVVVAAALMGIVEGQTARPSTTAGSAPTGTSTGSGGATHTIAVGAVGFNFEPNNITAEVGDIIGMRPLNRIGDHY
jgi:hypothetical protein